MDGATQPAGVNRLETIILTAVLSAAAVSYLGYHLAIALEPDDTNHLETPLALAVARQLRDGPGTLYGPFSGAMPLVLIHAPLYYRLAALGAWPLARLGFDPVVAAFAAGRVLSLLGLLGTLAAAVRLAGMDGGTARAGLWAALLIVAAPVIGSFPVTVRPDTLGLCLQTAGVALIVGELKSGRFRASRLVPAYLAFGLAVCVKQHDVVAATVSTGLLGWAWLQGRIKFALIAKALAAAGGIALAYVACEQWLTHGQMLQSVLIVPSAIGRVQQSGLAYVGTVFWEVAKMSIGLLAVAGACLVGGFRRAIGGRLDAVLSVYVAAELAVMFVLCLNSSGAWTNYAMQAVVLLTILAGRALGRLTAVAMPGWSFAGVGLAAVGLLLADARLVYISATARRVDKMSLEALFSDPLWGVCPPAELYFVGAPQNNRRYGRIDLAHDEWLYGAYEALAQAEPRTRWLQPALAGGPIVEVVAVGDSPLVRGLSRPLDELGFQAVARFGKYVVWHRPPAPGESAQQSGEQRPAASQSAQHRTELPYREPDPATPRARS